MIHDKIIVKGAKENNLKNIDIEIPRDKLVVFTGFQAQVNPHWLLILYMQKVREDISSHFLPMQECF